MSTDCVLTGKNGNIWEKRENWGIKESVAFVHRSGVLQEDKLLIKE